MIYDTAHFLPEIDLEEYLALLSFDLQELYPILLEDPIIDTNVTYQAFVNRCRLSRYELDMNEMLALGRHLAFVRKGHRDWLILAQQEERNKHHPENFEDIVTTGLNELPKLASMTFNAEQYQSGSKYPRPDGKSGSPTSRSRDILHARANPWFWDGDSRGPHMEGVVEFSNMTAALSFLNRPISRLTFDATIDPIAFDTCYPAWDMISDTLMI